MSFVGKTNNDLIKTSYQLTLNTLLSLPSLSIILSTLDDENIDKKQKNIILVLAGLSIIFILYSKYSAPLGILLSIASVYIRKQSDNSPNTLLYNTLLTQNILIGSIMTIQYILRN